jgi:hypothetical protein
MGGVPTGILGGGGLLMGWGKILTLLIKCFELLTLYEIL